MSSSPSILSQTLQSITVTKIRELEKQRQSFESAKNEALEEAGKETSNVRKRVLGLHNRVAKLEILSPSELENMRRWIDQAEFDPSIGDTALFKFEDALRSRLEIESRKLSLADLYSRLLTEWIDSPNNGESEPSMSESTLDEPFEIVQSRQKERLQQLRDKFERVVFEPLHTDEVEIDNYLASLFAGETGHRALKKLRDNVKTMGVRLLEQKRPLDVQTLIWCIKALLKNELLNDEKKASLQDFLRDDAVLNEIKDVLNMRFRDIRKWSWNLGTEGMPVLP